VEALVDLLRSSHYSRLMLACDIDHGGRGGLIGGRQWKVQMFLKEPWLRMERICVNTLR